MKDILWMDNHVLIMTYEPIVKRSPKILYIRYDIKSSKVIALSIGDCMPSIFEKIDLRNEM